MDELKRVVKALKEIQLSVNHSLSLKRNNLEKLSSELHILELRHGINLGQTIYHFMHSFHRK